MKKLFLLAALTFITVTLFTTSAIAEATIGQPAPHFMGTNSHGKTIDSNDLKGKIVVLEWTNDGCPFVHKFYDEGHMQSLQKKYTDEGVVWLSIVSSAPGKQGHVTPKESLAIIAKNNSHASARILDATGEIGHLYGAKTTPHMFVIDKDGTLVYAGAMDNNPSFRIEAIKGAHNYVGAALDELIAGKKVTVSTTKPYGCSIKY